MSVEERLEHLERQNKWMRRIGAVGVAMVASVSLMGQGKPKELPDLVVRSLTVTDNTGKARARLRADFPSLEFLDSNGRPRLSLGTAGNVPTLELLDKNERVRLKLSGSGGPRLTLYDGNKTIQVMLSALDEQAPSLDICDTRGEGRVSLGVSNELPFVHLLDKNGRSRATIGAAEISDERTGAKTTTAENTLTLFDAKGKVIWQAPKD